MKQENNFNNDGGRVENIFTEMPLEKYTKPLGYPEEITARYNELLSLPEVKKEVIGVLHKPNDLQEKAEQFLSKNKKRGFMNARSIGAEELPQIIKKLPESFDILSFSFEGKNKNGANVIIVGGEHGNELSSVNSCLWLVERFSKKQDLGFLFDDFRRIAIVPDYAPYGSALGLRMGVMGRDPAINNYFFSEKSKQCFLQSLPDEQKEFFSKMAVKGASPEEKIFRDFLKDFAGTNFVITLHEKNKNNKTALLISGFSKDIRFSENIARNWQEILQSANFDIEAENVYPGLKMISEGIFQIESLTPDILDLPCEGIATIEAGSLDFQKRLLEHNFLIISLMKTIVGAPLK